MLYNRLCFAAQGPLNKTTFHLSDHSSGESGPLDGQLLKENLEKLSFSNFSKEVV
jgi:hypothetical protein